MTVLMERHLCCYGLIKEKLNECWCTCIFWCSIKSAFSHKRDFLHHLRKPVQPVNKFFFFTQYEKRSTILTCINAPIRRIHTQERLRFPSRLKYRDFLRLSRQVDISHLSPSGIILLTELRMPHIKQDYNPCPCFDMLAWNDGIENTKIICSSVHTSAAMQIIALIPK